MTAADEVLILHRYRSGTAPVPRSKTVIVSLQPHRRIAASRSPLGTHDQRQNDSRSPFPTLRQRQNDSRSPFPTLRQRQTESRSPSQTLRQRQTESRSPSQTLRQRQNDSHSPFQILRQRQNDSRLPFQTLGDRQKEVGWVILTLPALLLGFPSWGRIYSKLPRFSAPPPQSFAIPSGILLVSPREARRSTQAIASHEYA
jgi:hypothetical protein